MTRVWRHQSCGSVDGYANHRRLDEPPCQPCGDAWALAVQAWVPGEHPIRYRACLDGTEVAEALTSTDRARLVATLHRRGWSDVQVATHCRMTVWVACEIRERLGLPRHRPADVPIRAVERAA